MADGFIKLYRKLLDNPVFQNEKLFKLFIWCLLKATYKDHEQLVGLQTVPLVPGQFVYGRIKASEELKLNPSTLKKYMKWLHDSQYISIKSTNKFSVVSIVNWALYQGENEEKYQQSTNKIPTEYQQNTTNKKDKKDKESKETIYTDLFEKFYTEYPNPFDKQQSFKNWNSTLKTDTVENIMLATGNYIKYLRDNQKTDKQYFVRSTNFLGQKQSYKGYLDYKQVEQKSQYPDMTNYKPT